MWASIRASSSDRIRKNNNNKLQGHALVTLLLLLLSFFVDDIRASDESSHADTRLGYLCKRIGSFTSIGEMSDLIGELKGYLDNGPSSRLGSNRSWNPLRSKDHTEPCLQQSEAILDLEHILEQTESVCSKEHSKLLERYHQKHAFRHKLITARFLMLYCNQVSFMCKLGLLHSLNLVSTTLNSDTVFEWALPWSSANSTESNDDCEKEIAEASREGSASGAEATSASSTKPISGCMARYALSNVHTIAELAEIIGQENQLIGFGQQSQETSNNIEEEEEEEGTEQEENSSEWLDPNSLEDTKNNQELYLVVPDKDRQKLDKMLKACTVLEPVYENTILPLVRLYRLGYYPEHREFERRCRENPLLRKWFSVALVCTPLLSSHLNDGKIQREFKDKAKEKSLVVVVDQERDHSKGGDKRSANDSSEQGLIELVRVPIEDELWLHKYTQTKLDRFVDGFYRSILKTFNVKEEADLIVFRRRARGFRRMTWKIVLMVLTAVALS